MQKEGCGYRNMRCDDQTSIHLHLLEGIRKKLPAGKVLSYTFPVSVFSDRLDFPYIDVVKYGLGYLDSISMLVMPSARAPTSNKTIQSVLDLGVPPSKVSLTRFSNKQQLNFFPPRSYGDSQRDAKSRNQGCKLKTSRKLFRKFRPWGWQG